MYKSVPLNLRLSPGEAEIVEARRGPLSKSAYVRSLIMADAPPVESPLTEQMPAVPTVTDAAYPGETPMVDQVLPPEVETVSTNDPEEVAVKKHFHKRGKEIGHRMHRGQKIITYACAEPGCTHVIAAD